MHWQNVGSAKRRQAPTQVWHLGVKACRLLRERWCGTFGEGDGLSKGQEGAAGKVGERRRMLTQARHPVHHQVGRRRDRPVHAACILTSQAPEQAPQSLHKDASNGCLGGVTSPRNRRAQGQ